VGVGSRSKLRAATAGAPRRSTQRAMHFSHLGGARLQKVDVDVPTICPGEPTSRRRGSRKIASRSVRDEGDRAPLASQILSSSRLRAPGHLVRRRKGSSQQERRVEESARGDTRCCIPQELPKDGGSRSQSAHELDRSSTARRAPIDKMSAAARCSWRPSSVEHGVLEDDP
jgi:hypothetical protein